MKTIRIKDYDGKYRTVPVSDELYEEWRKLENESQRIYRATVRHRSSYTLDEADLMTCQFRADPTDSRLIEEEENARLMAAIDTLSPIQARRMRMLIDGLSLREISEVEHRHYNSVKDSILTGLKKIQPVLNRRIFK